MKKSILIIAMTLFLASYIDGIAAIPIKPIITPSGDFYYQYGSTVQKAWKQVDDNDWGDRQWWCVNYGVSCGEFDWYVEVSSISFSNPNNTAQCMIEFQAYMETNRSALLDPNYGWNMSIIEAAKENIILNSSPPNPGVIEKFVFPFGN